MASVIDSIRSVYQDNYALVKLGIFSYAIYLIFSLINTSKLFDPVNFLFWITILYLYLGFCSIIIGNRINQKIDTLPTPDPILFAKVATKSSVIFLPFSIIGFLITSFMISLFNFEGLPQIIAVSLTRYFIFSFIITALINFAENFNLKEGLNITKLLNGVADVLVYTLLCIIVLLIFSVFTVAPTLYLIYTFFKTGPLFSYAIIFFVTMYIAILGDYWGQLHFDIESKNNYY